LSAGFAEFAARSALAALLGIGVAATQAIAGGTDSDSDGVPDGQDNCVLVANPAQIDTDADGAGNFCDPDFNQDCIVNFSDLGVMNQNFFTANDATDLNSDGVTNFGDLIVMRSLFFSPPGPAAQDPCSECTTPSSNGGNSDFAGLQMFVRGGLFDDWAAAPANRLADNGDGTYTARFEATAGSYEFKVADEGWSVEYCSTTNQVSGVPVTLPLFGCTFPANGTIDIPATGCHEFTMTPDGNVPPFAVELEFNPVP
jgi:hypothetical protein